VNRHTSFALGWLLLQALFLGCSACGFVDTAEAGASHPFARHALPAADRHWISGHVQERVLAGNYVYLRLREPSGRDSWLVSLKVTTPKAQEVRALIVGRAAHFHSRQLERDFSPLLFAAVRSVAD
jgi:hypothetical protein